MHSGSYRALVLASTSCLGIARAGPAINQFEVKDLEVEVGQWEFQSQNAYSWNHPDRDAIETAPGEFAFDENSVVRQRYALELELGITQSFRSRFGIELEQERVDDPQSLSKSDDFDSLELAELAVEGVWVLRSTEATGIGVGLLAEYQYTLDSTEADSLVFGPIIELVRKPWSLLLNPAVVQFFNAENKDNKLDFTYALQFAYVLSDQWSLAMEAYGTLDRLASTGSPDDEAGLFGDHDLHRLGPVAYYRQRFVQGEEPSELRLGAGVFAGLNSHTPGGTFKLSIEYEF